MPLSTGKLVFQANMIAYYNELKENADKDKADTIIEHVEKLSDEIEAFIKTATLNVPGLGLIAPAGTAGGPVTGTSVTGTLE